MSLFDDFKQALGKAWTAVAGAKVEPQPAAKSAAYVPEVANRRFGGFSTWTADKAIREGMLASTWVYACIRKIGDASASVRWGLEIDGEPVENPEDYPMGALWAQPNPFMSQAIIVERLTAQLLLTGNAFLIIVTDSQKVPLELWPITPDALTPVVKNRGDFITEYRVAPQYRTALGRESFPAEEVIHFQLPNPADPYWGVSPLQVAAKVVDTETQAVDFNYYAMQNRAVSDGAFIFPAEITIEQWESAKKMIRDQHQGAKNSHAPWVLGGGPVWQPMSMSPVDLDFIEGRGVNRIEICAVFGVPPPVVGIPDASTYNNIETARRILWTDTVIPHLDRIEERLNDSLAPFFGESFRLSYDLGGVQALQELLRASVDTAQKFWAMGVPFNVINSRMDLGFPEIPGGDEGYLTAGLAPASALSLAGEDTVEAPAVVAEAPVEALRTARPFGKTRR